MLSNWLSFLLLRFCAAGNGPIPLKHPCLASLPAQPASFFGHEGLDANSSWLKLCIAGWIVFLLSACFMMILVRERGKLGAGHQEREENMKTAFGCGKTFVLDPAEASNFGAEVAGACAKTMHNWMDLMPEPWMDPARNYFWQLAGLGAWCGGG